MKPRLRLERFTAAGVVLRETAAHIGRSPRRENTMRYWKKMVAGGAAMMISAGAAHAGQAPSAVDRARKAQTPSPTFTDAG